MYLQHLARTQSFVIESIFSGNQNPGGGGMTRKPGSGSWGGLIFHIRAVKEEGQ